MAKKPKYYVRPDGLHESIRKINGKRVAFRGKTDREVDRKILEYREEIAKGRMFSAVADEWERKRESEISESTRRVYRCAVRRMKEVFGQMHVSEIQPHHVQNYIRRFEAQGRSKNSVQIELAVCKMIFSYAVVEKDIEVSPASEIKKSRGLPVKMRRPITEEEEKIIKTNREAHEWMLPFFLLYTGMRRGEALAINYSDIDRKNRVIHVRKKLSYATGHPVMEEWLKSENGLRDIPLLKPLETVLPRNRVGLVFPGESGGFMGQSEFYGHWKKYCHEAGLSELVKTDEGKLVEVYPLMPHCLRHSFATICYEAGLDARQIAQMLGDTPETSEKVYTHLREKQMKSAAEMLADHLDSVGLG